MNDINSAIEGSHRRHARLSGRTCRVAAKPELASGTDLAAGQDDLGTGKSQEPAGRETCPTVRLAWYCWQEVPAGYEGGVKRPDGSLGVAFYKVLEDVLDPVSGELLYQSTSTVTPKSVALAGYVPVIVVDEFQSMIDVILGLYNEAGGAGSPGEDFESLVSAHGLLLYAESLLKQRILDAKAKPDGTAGNC